MQDKIVDEYVNFMGVFQSINNIGIIAEIKLRQKLFVQLFQHILEDRILYRYKIKMQPYHGYNKIEDQEEYEMIDTHFRDKKEYMKSKNDINEVYEKLDEIKKYFIDTCLLYTSDAADE